MAYGLYLYKNVTTKGNRVVRLEIWSKDYTGSSAEIEAMGASPFSISIDNSGGSVEEPLIKTNLNIVIKDTNQVDYDLFFTPDATKFKVIIKISGVDYWVGYLTPDSYSESLSYRSDIVLTARDNLGMLSEIKYERAGKRATMRTLLNEAMALISFGNTLEYRQKKTSGTLNILDAYIRCDRFIGKTWADVVQTILHDCGLQMRFVGAAKYAIYDIGEIVNLGTTISTQTFKFIEESGQREIIPAARTITLNQDYGSVDNSYDGVLAGSEYSFRDAKSVSQPVTKDISTPQVFSINYYDPLSSVWGGVGGLMGIVNPNEWNEAPSTIMLTGDLYDLSTYRQAIVYSQIMPVTAGNVEVKFQVSNLVKYPAISGSDYVWKDYFFEYIKDPSSALIEWFGAKYQVKFRCNIFLVGATKTYVMREKWEEYVESPVAEGKYLTFILPSGGNAGEFPNLWEYNAKDEELKFNIQTIPEDGTLRIAFYPYELTGQFVQLYPSVEPQDIKDNIPLTYPILVKNISIKYPAFEVGGLESSAVINSAHNVAYNIDLELGQVPQGIGDSATMYGGLFNTGVNFYKALGDFFVTAGTEYHLSELIGREIANIYKEQREKLSGTIITDVNFSVMPSFGKTFTDGVKYYAINSGTLDFISEQMQVEMIEVEPYLYEDFTFIEATIDTGGTSLGSGETEFIQWSAAGNAKRIYELDTASEADQGGAFVFIDKSGLTAAKKVPISSLLVDAYTKTESDSRFASIDGDLTQDFSAKKLTTATLLLPQSAPTLASGEAAIYSLDSGFSGETPSGSGSVTSISLTMPTGFAVSGSPITESGTFGVTFASGYFLPTTAQFASKLDVSLKGSANGLAELDENGFVKNTQLPSYVDDVLEYDNLAAFPATGETGKIYIAKDTNKTYRWSGTGYAVISETIALGETSSTAYRGDRGKIAYDHSQITSGNPHGTTAAQVGALALGGGTLTNIVNNTYAYARQTFGNLAADGDVHIGASGNASPANGELDYGFYVAYNAYRHTDGLWYHSRPTTVSAFVFKGGYHNDGFSWEFANNNGTSPITFTRLMHLNSSGVLSLGANTVWHSGNLLNIGTTASSARTALELGSAALKSDTYFALLAGSISQPFSASKLTSTTLLLPQATPSLSSGEMAIYGLESGFSGETPSGAGSVTSISMVVPTGLSVTPATITESGTFTISYASGYSIPTNTKQSEWDNAYTLRHNAVTLGTANGLSLSTQELSLGLASASANGALSSTDWNTFNSKAAGDHNHNGTYALISGATTQDFQAKNLTLAGSITGATTITASSTIQATTAKLTNLTDGYIPYHISDASGLGNSSLYYNGTNYGIGTTNPEFSDWSTSSKGLVIDASSAGYSILKLIGSSTAKLILTAGSGTNYLWCYGANPFAIGVNGTERFIISSNGNVGIGYTDRDEKFAVNGTTYFNGNSQVIGSLTMTENINTNLRIPKVAPTSPTSGQYYFYIVE